MPADPYTVLRALLQAEALRSTPKPKERPGEQAPADPETPLTDQHPSHRQPPN
ncbi:hypothetical protein [Streptomyces sp. NPDC057438]|uniref:hypothetical protein n=1 Tax=Streptomyces sp. NPDC057438 TaxID=3346133 RepID=UPI0036850529